MVASNSTDKDCLSKGSEHKDEAAEQVECMLAINMEHSRKVVSKLTLVLEIHTTRMVMVLTEMQQMAV